MKLDKHVVDMFTELTKPADDVKMEKTCYGTISVVDGTRYVKLDGSDLLVPAASTVKTSHGDRVTVLMKNHSLTVTGNLTAPATDGEGGSSGEAGTAATIEVGTVTTGEAGSSASVTNSGTTSAAVFDFVIPRGDKGEKGDTGPQGPQGEKGDTGTWDGTIPDHEHTVSDITDFPTSLPANGGDADTVDGLHANEIASNPNLLDNPDFKINQRGQTVYNGSGYTVDRWRASSALTVTVSDSITVSAGSATGYFEQYFDRGNDFDNKLLTLSAHLSDGTVLAASGVCPQAPESGRPLFITIPLPDGNDVRMYRGSTADSFSLLCQLRVYSGKSTGNLRALKLELGSIATQFCPPDPATELTKCQRYFYRLGGKNRFFRLYGIAYGSNSLRFSHNLPVEMRTTPTLTSSPGKWRLCVCKFPYDGGYWNHTYGTTFAVDGLYSSPSNVHICVELDSSKTVNISVGDSVALYTNPDVNSDGSQKYPGWLDFDAEL